MEERFSTEYREFLLKNYPGSAEYKISTYAVFLERALRLARAGGLVHFILPDSFLAGKYFTKLRQTILASADIEEICICFENFWKGAQVGFPVIIRLRKLDEPTRVYREKVLQGIEPKGPALGNKIKIRFAATADHFKAGKFDDYHTDQKIFFSTHNHRMTLFLSETQERVYHSVNRLRWTLKNFVTIESGLCAKKKQESIVSEKKRGPDWKPGLNSASQLKEFHCLPSKQYLQVNRRALVRGYNVNYAQPKLLIPKTGDRIKCALDKKGLAVTDNLQVVTARKPFEALLPALCGILNSAVFNYYYRMITLEEGRAQAQTDIDTLYSIPLTPPAEQPALYEELNELVKKLTPLMRRTATGNAVKVKLLRDRIEYLVAAVLNIRDPHCLEEILSKTA